MYIKPPIGVSPHWFLYRQRMVELNEAIQRYLDHINQYHIVEKQRDKYECIASWCDELKTLALLEAELECASK